MNNNTEIMNELAKMKQLNTLPEFKSRSQVLFLTLNLVMEDKLTSEGFPSEFDAAKFYYNEIISMLPSLPETMYELETKQVEELIDHVFEGLRKMTKDIGNDFKDEISQKTDKLNELLKKSLEKAHRENCFVRTPGPAPKVVYGFDPVAANEIKKTKGEAPQEACQAETNHCRICDDGECEQVPEAVQDIPQTPTGPGACQM